MSTTCTHSHSTENNEYTRMDIHQGISRSYSLFFIHNFYRKDLLFSTWCDILLTEKRKGTLNCDLYVRNRRILHTRRNSNYSPSHRGHRYQAVKKKENAWVQNRRLLENKQDRVQRVPRSTAEYSRQQIKRATVGWQGTTIIQYLVAVSLLLPRSQALKKKPRDSLPVSSIHRLSKKSRAIYKKWGSGRKHTRQLYEAGHE